MIEDRHPWWWSVAETVYGKSYTLASPWSVEECRRRLDAHVAHSLFTRRPVRGVVRANRFSVTRTGARNDFRPTAMGRFLQDTHGTTIMLRMHTMRPLFVFGVIALVPLSVVAAMGTRIPSHISGAAFGLLVFDIVSLAIYGFLRWSARGDEEFLLTFLCQVLDARRLAV